MINPIYSTKFNFLHLCGTISRWRCQKKLRLPHQHCPKMYIIQSVRHKTLLMSHSLPWLSLKVSPGMYLTADNHKGQNNLILYTWLYIWCELLCLVKAVWVCEGDERLKQRDAQPAESPLLFGLSTIPTTTQWDTAGASTWVSICLHLHRYLLWGSVLTRPSECSSTINYFSRWWGGAVNHITF